MLTRDRVVSRGAFKQPPAELFHSCGNTLFAHVAHTVQADCLLPIDILGVTTPYVLRKRAKYTRGAEKGSYRIPLSR